MEFFELVISVGTGTNVIIFETKNYIRFARKNMNEIFASFLLIRICFLNASKHLPISYRVGNISYQKPSGQSVVVQ